MIYITLGTAGFIIVHIFDIVSIKKLPVLKPVIWSLGSILLAYATVRLVFHPDKFALPEWLVWASWIVAAASLALFLHSLFVNLPFRKTYVNTGVGDKLITTGLYSLVRHPGVIWYAALMISLLLASQSTLLLIAAPMWILLDVILVIIQDKYVFGRMFTGYAQYQKETPMLLPSRKSLATFLNQLKGTSQWRKHEEV